MKTGTGTGINPEAGATLVVSLLILLVMSVLATTSLRGTALEERMAGAHLDQNTAFQAAETALREGESFLEGVVSLAAFDGTGGLYGIEEEEPDPLVAEHWDAGGSQGLTHDLEGVAQQPRFMIKQIGEIPLEGGGGSIGIGRYGQQAGGAKVQAFRITARGVGGSSHTTAVVQSYYGKAF